MSYVLKTTVICGFLIWVAGACIVAKGITEIDFPVRGEKDGMVTGLLLLMIGLSYLVISLPLVIIAAIGGSRLSWQVRTLGIVPLVGTTIGLALIFWLEHY